MHGRGRVMLAGPALLVSLAFGTPEGAQVIAATSSAKTVVSAASQNDPTSEVNRPPKRCKVGHGLKCCWRHGRWSCDRIKKEEKPPFVCLQGPGGKCEPH